MRKWSGRLDEIWKRKKKGKKQKQPRIDFWRLPPRKRCTKEENTEKDRTERRKT